MVDWSILPYVYISIQCTLALCVSLIGMYYVKVELERRRSESIAVNSISNTIDNTSSKNLSPKNICKLYFKVIWKMRSVYSSFIVHIFDIFTDYLIIIEWFELGQLETKTNDKNIVKHIDPTIMAYCSISVLIVHKITSIIAFWNKEKSIRRCILVFFELLIFEEIYVSHSGIVRRMSTSQDKHDINNNNNKKASDIDTTTSFKYVRNLEAVFESIPQSVLQTVFLMRTEWQFNNINENNVTSSSDFLIAISAISIIQSIVSMSNAIIKNDNCEMTLPQWKIYKKRFPPSKEFLKHSLWRFSEIIYRIGLLSLIWTVCEGYIFSLIIGIEFLLLFILIIPETSESIGRNLKTVNGVSDILIRMQTIIILPSRLIYRYQVSNDKYFDGSLKHFDCDPCFMCCFMCCWHSILSLFCCYHVCICVTTSNMCNDKPAKHYFVATVRIGISFVEWIFLILYSIYGANGSRLQFLISMDHGLIVFVVGIVMFIIYTQYLYLFPNFSLPRGVSSLDIEGLAFNGELAELQRLDSNTNNNSIELFTYDTVLYALSNEQYHVVEWLEKEKNIMWKTRLKNESVVPIISQLQAHTLADADLDNKEIDVNDQELKNKEKKKKNKKIIAK